MVAAIEDHPDGSFDDPDLHKAIVSSSSVEGKRWDCDAYWIAKDLGRTFYKTAAEWSPTIALDVAKLVAQQGGDREAEFNAQDILFRDIFGTPLSSICIDSAWLNWNGGAVDRLARSIYDDRAFDFLPLLADVLEGAGCTSDKLLSHCREPGPHVRGCWAIDSLLGKA